MIQLCNLRNDGIKDYQGIEFKIIVNDDEITDMCQIPECHVNLIEGDRN